MVLLGLLVFAVLIVSATAMSRATAAHQASQRYRAQLQVMNNRLQRLEQQIAAGGNAPAAPPQSEPTPEPQPHATAAAPPPPAPPIQPPLVEPKPAPPPVSAPPPVTAATFPKPIARPAPSPAPTPARTVSLEERLSTRVFVWIGGIALVLAGAYFVQYSFQHALFPPQLRLALGFVFGFALLIGAEPARKNYERIGQALAGASVAVFFAVLLAGVHLYEIIPTMLGFVLMAAVTAGAVGLSLRHGPFVALLGLIGGFATPALIGGDGPVGVLFTYLLLLQIGLVVVSRRQGWSVLSLLTLLAALAWGAFMLLFDPYTAHRTWLGAYLLGTTMVFVMAGAVRGSLDDASAHHIKPVALGLGAMVASGLMLLMLVIVGQFSTTELGMLALLSAGALLLARLDDRYITMAPLVAGLSAITLLAWSLSDALGGTAESFSYGRFAAMTGLFAAIFGMGGYLALWGAKRPAVFAAVSIVSTIVFLLITRFTFTSTLAPKLIEISPLLDWWIVTGALALLAGAAAVPLYRRRDVLGTHSVNIMAMGAVVLAGFAVPMAVDHPWPPTGWTALALLLVLLRQRYELTALRWAIGLLSSLAAALLLLPGPLDVQIGERIIFNVLLAQYGLPALAVALIAWRLPRCNDQPLAQVHQALATGIATLGILLLIRHAFHGPDVFDASPAIGFIEWATYAIALLVCGQVLAYLARRSGQIVLETGGLLVAGVGLTAALLGTLLMQNPIWTAQVNVGDWIIFNWLLLAYALPALLAATLAWMIGARPAWRQAAILVAAAAVTLFAIMVLMQVRHGFHGPVLAGHDVTLMESATYVVALLTLAIIALVTAQRWSNLLVLREAAMAMMWIAGVVMLAGPVIMLNPLWHEFEVGHLWIINRLLYIYCLPSLLAAACLPFLHMPNMQAYRPVAAVTAAAVLMVVFLWLNLQVRHFFHGTRLDDGSFLAAEQYAYSLAWVLFAVLLAALGIWRASAALRSGSLIVMLLAVAKVFFYDTGNLQDLYRVLSFLGLGVSLLLLGLVYQRFVFSARLVQVKQPVESKEAA